MSSYEPYDIFTEIPEYPLKCQTRMLGYKYQPARGNNMNDFDVIQAEEMAFCDVPAESNADFDWDFGGEEYSYSECEDGYLDTYWESLTEY